MSSIMSRSSTHHVLFCLSLIGMCNGFVTAPRTTTRHRAPRQAFASEAWSEVNVFFETQPYLAAFLTCSFKTSAADIIAQARAQEEEPSESPYMQQQSELVKALSTPWNPLSKPQPILSSSGSALSIREQPQEQLILAAQQLTSSTSSIDVSRNLGFLLYGGLYTGMAQNYFYNVLYPALFGTEQSWSLIAKEVAADNLLFAPFLCLPVAYAFKTAFANGDLSLDTLKAGLDKYVYDVTHKGLLAKYWSVWIPVQALTFSVIPAHFRVVFVAAVSFGWIFLLSSICNQQEEE